MRLLATLVLLVAAACATAQLAPAKRAPSASERAKIKALVNRFIAEKGSPAARDDKIASLAVSTVDPRYAVVHLKSKTVGSSVMFIRVLQAQWSIFFFGSAGWGCNPAGESVMEDLVGSCNSK